MLRPPSSMVFVQTVHSPRGLQRGSWKDVVVARRVEVAEGAGALYGQAVSSLSPEGVVVVVSMPRWAPSASLCLGPHRRGGGAGEGSGHVRSRIRAAAALWPCPGPSCPRREPVPRAGKRPRCPKQGRTTASGLPDHKAPVRDGRGGQVWDGLEAGQRRGREEGAHSRAQRRPRAAPGRTPPGRAEWTLDAPLQRWPAQHCLTIFPDVTGPEVHSYCELVLGHLGAQRLLSMTFALAPAREELAGGLWPAGSWAGGEGAFPMSPGNRNST